MQLQRNVHLVMYVYFGFICLFIDVPTPSSSQVVKIVDPGTALFRYHKNVQDERLSILK